MGLGLLLWTAVAQAQSPAWMLAKEDEGIRVFTRENPGKPLKSFRGVTTIAAPAELLLEILRNAEGLKEWLHDIRESKSLERGQDAFAYYTIFDSPWPVSDRLFVVRGQVKRQTAGKIQVEQRIDPKLAPDLEGGVRVVEAHFTWTLVPQGQNRTEVTYQGYTDPAGDIPNWLANSAVVDSPFHSLRNLKAQFGGS